MVKFKGWSWWIINDREYVQRYGLVYAESQVMVISITGVSKKTHRITRATHRALRDLYKVEIPKGTDHSSIAFGPLSFLGISRQTTLYPTTT